MDADADTDMDSDADTDADTDADSDSLSPWDTDMDSDADTDADTDSGGEVTGCSTGTAQSGDVTVELSDLQQKISGFGLSNACDPPPKLIDRPRGLGSSSV